MLSCRETAKLLSESLDQPIPFRRRMGLRLHLLMCRLCRRYARQIRILQRLVRGFATKVSEEEGDPAGLGEMSPEAKERAKSALRDES